jgi:hypothetical protein
MPLLKYGGAFLYVSYDQLGFLFKKPISKIYIKVVLDNAW